MTSEEPVKSRASALMRIGAVLCLYELCFSYEVHDDVFEKSHYSIKSAAAVCGIGCDFCFNIVTDNAGKMIPEALEMKIVEAKKDG
ncbi:hypothetical protein DICVIV_03748 [Dictyocaulus viviparus]|uniref:Uncharacterized protein n=1 Tax=Dictyocaulus viviparus TaxID=29172 RepID=A0A0D8Y694_DICVI|nr:hypothetical protein DICVIV_03748 [Dictyocaulus viviparus]